MNDDIQWITRGGKHIPITNAYMNDKIRYKKMDDESQKLRNKIYNLEEKKEKIVDDYYQGETEFFDENELDEELNKIENEIKKLKEELKQIDDELIKRNKKQVEEMGGLL